MVANNCIPKPTFYTFAFYKKLKGTCIHKDNDCIMVKTDGGSIRGIAWNICEHDEDRKDKHVMVEVDLTAGDTNYDAGRYCITRHIVDEETCNPLKVWNDYGQPRSLSPELVGILRQAAVPMIQTQVLEKNPKSNIIDFGLFVKPNGVIYFEIVPAKLTPDRGYEY